MAGILIERSISLAHGKSHGPLPRERRGIIYGVLVVKLVTIHAPEALDDMEILGRPAAAVVIRCDDARLEVRRVDNQRVAFPVSTRIAQPVPDSLVRVPTAVQGNDA